MRTRRRSRGFEPGGSFPADQLGLTRRRAVELELHRGWRRIVGEATSERVRLLSLRRGVVRVAIGETDPEQAHTLREMLPGLLGRLCVACPRLGIRRFRVEGPDGEPGGSTTEVRPPRHEEREGGGAPSRAEPPDEALPALDPRTRLNRIMARCLGQSQKP